MKYTITYVIRCNDSADPSTILDAAHEAADELVASLESVDVHAKIDEQDTVVAPVED